MTTPSQEYYQADEDITAAEWVMSTERRWTKISDRAGDQRNGTISKQRSLEFLGASLVKDRCMQLDDSKSGNHLVSGHNVRYALFFGLAAVILIFAAYRSLFTVYQTKQALVVRLGEPVRVITEPGLHVKWPLIDTVITVDNRILDLENAAQEVFASDQRRLVIDAFARYRVTDVMRFYQTVTNIEGASARLSSLLNAALRRVLGEATLIHVVRDDRVALMARVRDQLDREAHAFGIEVVDVRIKRVDLPDQNSQAVYQRMQTERRRQAASIRGGGNQKSLEIRAKADRDVTVIVAEAQSRAEQIRGEGDAERNRIFAEAFGKDPDFFAFYRSMQAYEAGLRANNPRLVLRPDSDFFKYFANPAGTESVKDVPKPVAPQPPPSPLQPAADGKE
jgi:membrane protease subunit HflC